jgi:hypothetical protein
MSKTSFWDVNFWYVATPYTKYPHGHQAAADEAASITARLMRAGVRCFSPIAHSHAICIAGLQDMQHDSDFWCDHDEPLLLAAGGLLVVTLEGWKNSSGIKREIDQFIKDIKPIVYWDPTTEAIPEDVL